MKDFQQSLMWKKTLASQPDLDPFFKEREFLRQEFINFREKAGTLASEIAQILPEYTVHNIEHIDALWEMVDLIVPKDFDINPAESFVLGGAFLLHDLGMALAAYPKGLGELKEEKIWQDTFASLKRNNAENKEKDDLPAMEKKATETTLRLLHAKRATELINVSWKNTAQQEVFLIDNEELRSSLGKVIGLVAYSHWLKIDELEETFLQPLGALTRFPSDWTVDALKLACILRLADAIQIDDRRAPSFLKSLRQLPSSAMKHWNFQQKLYQPRIENKRIIYTSKMPFYLNEVDSWWQCFDTLKMIDNELKQVDSLFSRKYKTSFDIIGVSAIEDIKQISKLITVEGWEPLDIKIRVNNVAKLVSNIGGEQLYGKNAIVPLRELIQNAADAIRARRLMEDESNLYGDIFIQIGSDQFGTYVEVEDNGIGMSANVLTGPFLDFGQSFWGTNLMHEELPGLESKGYKSTGKYGIGFFSLFMWGQKILISTNRFNKGRKDTLVMELNDGAESRPILRKAKEDEYIRNGGTRIKVWVKEETINDILNSFNKNRKKTISETIENLCPSIDCNIFVKDKKESKLIIKANDWIDLPCDNLLKRVIGKTVFNFLKKENKNLYDIIINNMSIIKDENQNIIGRAALYKREDKRDLIGFQGIVTVGGFKTSGLTGLIGIFIGESERAARDIGIPIVKNQELSVWMEDQIVNLEKQIISFEEQIEIAGVCRAICQTTGNLKIAECKDGFLNYNEIKEYVINNDFDKYILVHDAAISIYERENSTKIECKDNVFWMPMGIPGILQTNSIHKFVQWPKHKTRHHDFHDYSLKGLVIEAIADAWNCDIDELYLNSDFSDDDKGFSECIGMANDKNIIFDHISIIKIKPKSKNIYRKSNQQM